MKDSNEKLALSKLEGNIESLSWALNMLSNTEINESKEKYQQKLIETIKINLYGTQGILESIKSGKYLKNTPERNDFFLQNHLQALEKVISERKKHPRELFLKGLNQCLEALETLVQKENFSLSAQQVKRQLQETFKSLENENNYAGISFCLCHLEPLNTLDEYTDGNVFCYVLKHKIQDLVKEIETSPLSSFITYMRYSSHLDQSLNHL